MALINGTPLDDTLNGTAEDDLIIGFAGNDVLNGLDRDDSLFGAGGNDNLFGGAGDDELTGGLGNDLLNGGAGIDTADYSDDDFDFPSATAGITVNLNLQGIAQNTGGAGIDTLVSIENLGGTDFNDTLIGNAADNELSGQNGNDTLSGGAGDDRLFGGSGNDLLDGGSGADILIGGDGIDTVSYSTATAGVMVNLEFGSQPTGGAGIDLLGGFENLTGTNFSDSLIGNSANNVLFGLDGDDTLNGGAGNDLLNGGAGSDSMDGGAGNDTYVIDNIFDVVIDRGLVSELDAVQSSINYTLNGTIENLTLTGAAVNGSGNAVNNVLTGNGTSNALWGYAGDDQLFGGAGTDTLIGGVGDDLLNGGSGADNMNGGDGNDTYVVDHISDVAAETFAEEGVDTIQASVPHTLNYAIEHLTLTGSVAINGTGNALNNALIGNSANNVLSGLNGNDTLTGGAGNDTLNGGNGNDVLTGGSGRDQLNGGAGNDRFDYNAVSESPTSTGRDVITGFAGAGTALGDQIDLRDIDANTLVSGNQAFTWRGATPGGAGTLWYTGGVLYGNIDGDATPEFQIQLVGSPALYVGGTGTDILL